MNDDLREYIRHWLTKANHDIIGAQIIFEHNPIILDVMCFHCQQAIEKYLKAYLIWQDKDIRKTHDVDKLLLECQELDNSFDHFDLKNLAQFAVEARYPDNFFMPEAAEAKEYLSTAMEIKALVENKIKL